MTPGSTSPADVARLSEAARDVVARVRGGERVTYDDLDHEVAAEVRTFARRFSMAIGEKPHTRTEPRTSGIAGWPRRQADAALNPLFSLADLSAVQRRCYDDALDVLAPQGDLPGMVALVGPRGTGKTFLACVIGQNLAAAAEGAPTPGAFVYDVAGDLFAAQRRSFGTRSGLDPLGSARLAELLCLDEIQERVASEWEQQEFTRLLDYRYREGLPTLLIGNLRPDELPNCLGQSVISRLQESGALIECGGESRRVAL